MEDNVIKEEILNILNEDEWQMKLKELMNVSSESEIEIEVKSITQADSNDFILVKLLVNGQGSLFAFDLNYNQSNNIVEVIATEDITETEIRNNKTSFDISYWSYNITYSQLSNMYEKKIIKVPDMQRGFVWSKLQASRLIESILMGLPLPSIFLVQIEEDGRKKYLVIDGLQRITAINSFIKNRRLPNSKLKNSAGFALSGVNKKFDGKTFDELDSEGLADNLELNTINVIEFKQSSPYTESAIYQVFERLNSGGTSLTSQQIRNSIYYGYFNKKLNEFSEKYISQYFSQSANLNLINSELVLRTISIFDLIRNDGGINSFSTVGSIVYKNLLNDTAEKYHIEFKKS
ncbi:GmrSD restriction endonuclease domain-containing protein, partial [Streptococcus mitis]|uniref:GmrSD restriction endonuclease domain-containing protein n=1 Tax=Streptococcus mitis TaxID=28037 RepID=UPI001072B89F